MNTEEYKLKLETELKTITSELSGIANFNEVTGDWEATPEAAAETSDLNVTADTAEDSAERQAMTSDLETRFRNLSLALAKIDNSTFGICELCSQAIEEARLEVNPAARTCITDRDRESELTL